MHSQNINNEHKNVDCNRASNIPGTQELNNTDSAKNGSEKKNQKQNKSTFKMSIVIRDEVFRAHCCIMRAEATIGSSISVRLTNQNMDIVSTNVETSTAIKLTNFPYYTMP